MGQRVDALYVGRQQHIVVGNGILSLEPFLSDNSFCPGVLSFHNNSFQFEPGRLEIVSERLSVVSTSDLAIHDIHALLYRML